ncbi:MAG: hypothetical protein KJO07_13610 [Deltaproteobacteria bacterium]|nr:hypothetical protein [Deltaproteobacteria bacterium]
MASLTDILGKRSERPPASFQLAGEGLSTLTGADLQAAASDYRERLALVPTSLRSDFETEQRRLADQSAQWLARYNRNLYSRLTGYWELGKLLRFDYPWPVVAMLGICQVLGGMWRARAYGLLGVAASRLRYSRLEKLADATDDILRRTNRAIFHDSVPTVLYALRCRQLETEGRIELARALEDGPLPPLFDEDSRQLIRALVRGLSVVDQRERFRTLAQLTMRHFDREQAVFSHQMGVDRRKHYQPRKGWVGLMTRIKAVPAPRVVGRAGERHIAFESFALPPDFDMRNHDSRVAAFGAAYVQSVTGNIDDYLVAIDYLHQRFAGGEPAPALGYIR